MMSDKNYVMIVKRLITLYDLADSIQDSLDEIGKDFASVKTEKMRKELSAILRILIIPIEEKQVDELQELLKVKPELKSKVQEIIEPLFIK